MFTHRLRRAAAIALVPALLVGLTACGDDGDQTADTTTADIIAAPTTAAAEFPVTIDAANGAVEIPAQPTTIVSLSPTATEMLYAIGAGDQVVAVDDESNYPPEAPITDLSGFTPNVEAISGYEPDLVVVADDAADLTGALEPLGVPVLSLPAAATLDDVYTQIEQLGVATGQTGASEELAAELEAEVAAIVAELPDDAESLSFYHELDSTYYTATSSTFIGQIYDLIGLQNIADPADSEGAGYLQLNAEYIITSDPDLIFLADVKCCDQSIDTVAARPGWAEMAAVQNDAVIELDDDVASRWGPRVVDLLQQIAAAVEQVAPVG
jgi:iron complex transport system substrate-binding protein